MIEGFSYIVFGLALACLLWVRCNTILTYFQQEEYDSGRFVTAWREVRLYDVKASIVFLLCMLAGWLFIGKAAALFLCAVVFLVIAWTEKSYRFKKPLAVTERLKRIRVVVAAVLVVLVLLCLLFRPLTLLVLQSVPFLIMLVNAALAPAQAKINEGFIQEARARLKESQALRIGITGSFGKTTVKHILAELLELSGPVFFSKGSINTELGLTRHIRQRLQPAHQYFIAEMGAYQIGSIERLCRFVEPDYGMVTAVGDAHAERFGGLEKTAIAKSELPDWICKHGKRVVVTEDVMKNKPFQQLQKEDPDKFIVVGHSQQCDVQILDSQLKSGAWQIELKLPDNTNLTYSIPLLGDHNIMNSALCVALVHLIDPSVTHRLPGVSKSLAQVVHRLELKENPGHPAMLDDAYNSNEQGFANAVQVLRQLADERGGQAIVVTPGIAELGNEHDAVHQRIGQHCVDHRCDLVIVVNPDRIPSFVKALGGEGPNVVLVSSLAAARQHLAELSLSEKDVVLYENDLPDLLEEHRLL